MLNLLQYEIFDDLVCLGLAKRKFIIEIDNMNRMKLIIYVKLQTTQVYFSQNSSNFS